MVVGSESVVAWVARLGALLYILVVGFRSVVVGDQAMTFVQRAVHWLFLVMRSVWYVVMCFEALLTVVRFRASSVIVVDVFEAELVHLGLDAGLVVLRNAPVLEAGTRYASRVGPHFGTVDFQAAARLRFPVDPFRPKPVVVHWVPRGDTAVEEDQKDRLRTMVVSAKDWVMWCSARVAFCVEVTWMTCADLETVGGWVAQKLCELVTTLACQRVIPEACERSHRLE